MDGCGQGAGGSFQHWVWRRAQLRRAGPHGRPARPARAARAPALRRASVARLLRPLPGIVARSGRATTSGKAVPALV